ncbi:hypothetical protein Tco_1517664 [Tanacetum coccineum]
MDTNTRTSLSQETDTSNDFDSFYHEHERRILTLIADDEKEDYVGGKNFKPSTSAWMNRRRLILEQQHESYFCWKHENENSTSSPPVWLLDLWRNTSNGTGVFIPRTRTGVFIPRTAGTRKGNKPSRKLTPRERRYNRMIKF